MRNRLRILSVVLVSTLSVLALAAENESASEKKLFLDVHHLGAGNVTAEAVAAAHEKDLAVQDKYGVSFEKYWVDEAAGVVYCLATAPDARALEQTHEEAHGLVPDAVHPVVQGE